MPIALTDALSIIARNICCNPRGLKRIINLLQLVVYIGDIKPRDKFISSIPIAKAEKKEWEIFREKCVWWIVLCQLFPYRMCMFLQVLLDFEQKREFNSWTNGVTPYSKDFLYLNGNFGGEIPDVDNYSILKFFLCHVDKFIQAFKKSPKFCRNDGDPEEFAYLLQRTAICENVVTCGDVLGPRDKSDKGRRDPLFSFLSYSFNLHSAMRYEVNIMTPSHHYNDYNYFLDNLFLDWRRNRRCCDRI